MRIYEQARSLHGSLKGLCALLSEQDERGRPMTLNELLAVLPRVLRTHHNEVVWQSDVSRRVKALTLG
jgi:hypothetical protein